MNTIKTFLTDESGATAIEYGLIAGLIAVAAIAAMNRLGVTLRGNFNVITDSLEGARR